MAPQIIPLDIGCQPSFSGSDEIVLSSGDGTAVIVFRAIDITLSERGFLEDLGIAIIKCDGCMLLQHGYPNDEGRNEHPLWAAGLEALDVGVCEVLDSALLGQVALQTEQSARRIWGASYESVHNVPEGGKRESNLRHFVFMFKESTLDCIAEDVTCTLHQGSYLEAVELAMSEVLD